MIIEPAVDDSGSADLVRIDRPEFDELYRARYAPMVRLAHAIVDTLDDAEHVVQDSFVGLYRRYDSVAAPEAYLRTSVVNNARKVLRRRTVIRRHPADAPEAGELEFNHVFDAVRRLPPTQRVLVALRYDQHLTDSEIAGIMSMPVGTVKSRLHRAIAALRQEIT